MTPEQKQELMRLLESGEEISPEWARVLFPPEKREYELVYHGKAREEDIIADTLAVPLQPVRTFGRNGADWHNMLIFGDNLQAMKTLLELKKEGKLCNADGMAGARLVYIDPPFATKQDFRGSQDQKAYQDKIAGAEFLEFLRGRFVLLKELLSNNGSIFIHLDQRKVHYVKVLLDEIFGENNFRNEITWLRSSSGKTVSKNVSKDTDYLLWYSKAENYIFHHQFQPLAESTKAMYNRDDKDRRGKYRLYPLQKTGSPGPETTYNYKDNAGRIWKCPAKGWRMKREKLKHLENEGRLFINGKTIAEKAYWNERENEGRIANNLWNDIANLQGATPEIVNYPTQKPEALLERIIEMTSDEGDLVLDSFSGSGTACTVAEKLKRRWISIDCGKLSTYTIQKRMLNLCREIGNKGTKLEPKPFTLFNAGLYDFSKLKELAWQDWRFFALQLFQCRDEPHKIGGVDFDGYRQGASVMVFNHMEAKHKEARITEETLQDIHEAVGSRVGKKVFIIAPALTFDFQQDYIDLDKVRYYALRIPYSIIHELHRREFTALKQPSDEMAVNDTVEAVGFDFIRTPELKYKTGTEKPKGELFECGFIKVETFKSDAVVREPFKKKSNLETLSMVMLDFDYDEEAKVFDLDEVHYADAIEKAGWKVRFRTDQFGKKMMAVFLDIYGNEARVLIDAKEFGKGAAKGTPKKKSKKKK